MTRYIAARALGAFVSILGVTVVVFVVLRLSGNPAALLIDPAATPEQYQQLKRDLGLEGPIPEQFMRYIGAITRGDFGTSFRYGSPALDVVLARIPATAQLAVAALGLTLLVSVPLGVLAAAKRNSPFDRAVSVVTLLGQGIPTFWLGISLILVVAVVLGALPTSGNTSLAHFVLPTITLAAAPISKFTRVIRSEMLEVLSQDYIRTARAKGLTERAVWYGHALKNASVALVTLIGLDVSYLLGGAVIVETVFAWPGLGRLMIDAVSQQDFPVVQADVLLLGCAVVVINLLFDISYPFLDPRIKLWRA